MSDKVVELQAKVDALTAENAKLIDDDNLWKHAQEMGYQRAIDDIKADNERLRDALQGMPCDCTLPQFQCSRCAALRGDDE